MTFWYSPTVFGVLNQKYLYYVIFTTTKDYSTRGGFANNLLNRRFFTVEILFELVYWLWSFNDFFFALVVFLFGFFFETVFLVAFLEADFFLVVLASVLFL